jgi:hypothetical protein
MSKQKSPHTQSDENVRPEQMDFEPDQAPGVVGDEIDRLREGAQSAEDRSFSKLQTRSSARRKIEPATAAYTGSVQSRAPKGRRQGITSRASDEESARQKKVVRSRPDARAGLSRTRE